MAADYAMTYIGFKQFVIAVDG